MEIPSYLWIHLLGSSPMVAERVEVGPLESLVQLVDLVLSLEKPSQALEYFLEVIAARATWLQLFYECEEI